MKCEQFTCSHHIVTGCGFPNCFYFTGLHNEVNAAAPVAPPEEKSELKEISV